MPVHPMQVLSMSFASLLDSPWPHCDCLHGSHDFSRSKNQVITQFSLHSLSQKHLWNFFYHMVRCQDTGGRESRTLQILWIRRDFRHKVKSHTCQLQSTSNPIKSIIQKGYTFVFYDNRYLFVYKKAYDRIFSADDTFEFLFACDFTNSIFFFWEIF